MKNIRQFLQIVWFVVACICCLRVPSWSISVGESLHPSATVHRPIPVSFKNDIEPILTHSGCNQGACHGSQFGKGGFKLSLAAYDPDLDYENILRQAGGRRVTLIDPNQSLLLRKPS